MIQTIRDAESKIWILQKEVVYFKTRINELSNEIDKIKLDLAAINKQSNNSNNNLDSIPTADGSSIVHRLLHIFDKIKVKFLEVTELTVDKLTAAEVWLGKLMQNLDGNGKNITGLGNLTTNNATVSNLLTSTDIHTINLSAGSVANVNSLIVSTNSINVRGEAGITQWPVVRVSGLTHTTGIINYKDHANNNQSLTVVTSMTVTAQVESLVGGIVVYNGS